MTQVLRAQLVILVPCHPFVGRLGGWTCRSFNDRARDPSVRRTLKTSLVEAYLIVALNDAGKITLLNIAGLVPANEEDWKQLQGASK